MSDRLLHTKVSKRKPLTHFPKKEDGHNGDMQIVSIKGKGTYLCVKDKSERKISERFNRRNKFDTHIFDEITTTKIKGRGGLTLTTASEQVTSAVFTGGALNKTGTITTSLSPVIRIGDGSNPGIITSNRDQDLILKTGNSTTAKIVMKDGANGDIISTLNGTGVYDVVWNSSDASSGEFALLNQSENATSGVHTNHQVSHTDADAYSRFTYLDDTASANIHWVAGVDGSADSHSSMYKINYATQEDAITPSSGTNVLSISKEGNTSLAGTLTIGSIATDTAGDNYLVEVSGVVKKRTPAETLADIGAQATVTAGTNCTFSGATLNVDDAFVKNDADDTMAGTLTIDKNTTATATATVKGAFIDYDHTDISASGQTVTGIGLDLDMDCGSVTHVGTVNQTGIDIDIAAADDGTQTNTGIDVNAAGGTNSYGINITVPEEDGDYHMKLMNDQDTSKFATFHTDGTGHLTIDTVADLKLDTATGITRFYLAGDTNDYASLTVAANGVTTLATFDDGGTIGHLTLDPDGDLLLQPATHTYSALPIGFTQDEPTFNATDTIITFSTKGNKAKLTLTNNCTDIHFKFPAVSGNFVCVLLQDGSGSRTISNWKTQDSAGNAGNGNSGLVLWAGGTAPSNTETADKADIASFYWDADNEIAYGTYTYNF